MDCVIFYCLLSKGEKLIYFLKITIQTGPSCEETILIMLKVIMNKQLSLPKCHMKDKHS
jgi:hypothetical protein